MLEQSINSETKQNLTEIKSIYHFFFNLFDFRSKKNPSIIYITKPQTTQLFFKNKEKKSFVLCLNKKVVFFQKDYLFKNQ